MEPRDRNSGERGVVLVSAVLLLLLTTVLAATFMATASGERSLASNVHIAKGSLYAADAGIRVMQQRLANLAQSKIDSLVLIWSGTGPVIGQPTALFPTGSIVTSASNPNFNASATITYANNIISDTSQVYNYTYVATATGRWSSYGQRKVQSEGTLRVSASRGSFADYLLFTDIHLTPSNGAIWFTANSNFDGRVHTNGEFRFSYAPSFQDLATSVHPKAWFYNKGNPKELAASFNGTIDVPNFYGGFTRNSPEITLPPNSFSQENAALGLSPASGAAASNTTINAQLGTGAGSGTPPNGIYLVQSGGAVTGGIYVRGNLDRCLMSLDDAGRQVYTLTQGSTTRKITLDRTANQTLVTDGGSTVSYAGLPRPILYTRGQVADLRGPDRQLGVPPPALAWDNQLLVAATGDIVLQRDVTYEDFNEGTNVLGIYSSGGSVRVGGSAPDDMNLDSYVMATGSSGSFTVDNYGNGDPRGTFHLRGGSVTTYYGAFFTFHSNGVLQTGYARDFHYDRRGIIPPYYPSTNRFTGDQPTARTLVWKEI